MLEEEKSRYLAWNACYNAREVGGYPTESGGQIRWHTLVRADNLNRLTNEGQAALREHGVRTVIDLRHAYELEAYPNPFASGEGAEAAPRYLHLPVHDVAIDPELAAAPTMASNYIMILERGKEYIGPIIREVAAGLERGPVLIHCHGGKDRTGIIVALLLSLAGVPRDTVVEDYAASAVNLEPTHLAWLEEQEKAQGKPVERPRWMYSQPETMAAVLDYLNREYGGVEAYLQSAGVTQEEMDSIRKHLVEPGGSEEAQ